MKIIFFLTYSVKIFSNPQLQMIEDYSLIYVANNIINPFEMITTADISISEFPLGIDEFIDIVKSNIHKNDIAIIMKKFQKLIRHIFDDQDKNIVLNMYAKVMRCINDPSSFPVIWHNDKFGNYKYYDQIHIKYKNGLINYESYYNPKRVPKEFLTLVDTNIGYPRKFKYEAKNSLDFLILCLYFREEIDYDKTVMYLSKSEKIIGNIDLLFNEIYKSNLIFDRNNCEENQINTNIGINYANFSYILINCFPEVAINFKINVHNEFGIIPEQENILLQYNSSDKILHIDATQYYFFDEKNELISKWIISKGK